MTEGGSEEGGLEELVEFLLSRSSRSAIRRSKDCTSTDTAACASGDECIPERLWQRRLIRHADRSTGIKPKKQQWAVNAYQPPMPMMSRNERCCSARSWSRS